LAFNLHWTWDRDAKPCSSGSTRCCGRARANDPLRLLAGISEQPGGRHWPPTPHRRRGRTPHAEARLRDAVDAPRWFQGRTDSPLGLVAYFSAEFGFSETLPQYSGGLGILAGDHLKAASDLGVPLTAIGLLYAEGYFRQRLNADGCTGGALPTAGHDCGLAMHRPPTCR
jgi:starch phosphorylase